MKFGTFYLLPEEHLQKNNTFSDIERLICTIIIKKWRNGKNILIACKNEFQAKRIDEILWAFNKNSFLPHNLWQKNMCHIPIVIYWPKYCYNNNISKNILINLMPKNMDFFCNFNEIIDFVPMTEILKKLARNRYQAYKKIGFQLRTVHSSIL